MTNMDRGQALLYRHSQKVDRPPGRCQQHLLGGAFVAVKQNSMAGLSVRATREVRLRAVPPQADAAVRDHQRGRFEMPMVTRLVATEISRAFTKMAAFLAMILEMVPDANRCLSLVHQSAQQSMAAIAQVHR